MDEIITNYCFIAWTALLAFLARRNANLGSLLFVMMIPKILDMAALTPLLQYIKSSDYRSLFFIVHALNDGLMILVVKYRWLVAGFIQKKSIYRKLAIEKYILFIYSFSIVYNLLVFGDYGAVWEKYFDMPKAFFFNYYPAVKETLTSIEAIILTVLTIQTIIAIRRLKNKGLID